MGNYNGRSENLTGNTVDISDVKHDLSVIVNPLSFDSFMNYLKNNNLLDNLKNDWFKIGNKYEYKFSSAFGGERINVLVRYEGQESNNYSILFAGDVSLFY
mgnify:CR=1 FL=1